MKKIMLTMLLTALAGWLTSCGDNEANEQLIGAECSANDQCPEGSTCLTAFKGGYCGKTGCNADTDCPEGSVCTALEGTNYCFLVCIDKIDCNQNRTAENESNCSSNVNPVDGGEEKVCVPPSG